MDTPQNKGIWEYNNLYSYTIAPINQITLGEGNTPVERLKFLEIETGVPIIYAKREDKNPTGSTKDRSIAFFFSYLKSKDIKEIIIPSSGNTAISAAYYSELTNITVYLFLSDKLTNIKNKRLKKALNNNKHIKIIQSKRPLSDSIKYSLKNNIELFRGSSSKFATQGYKSLGEELSLLRADSLFIPVSSGTTLVGLSSTINPNCHINIVQNSKINTISKLFDNKFTSETTSLSDSIVARVTERKKSVENIINKSKGWGWTVENSEIEKYHRLLEKNGILTSFESSMTLAALTKAIRSGYKFKKVILCFTGI